MTVEATLTEPMVDPRHRRATPRTAATGRPRCSKRSASKPATCGAIRTSSPAASGSGSASPGRSPSSRSSSSATNRSRRSTSRCRPRCSTCSRSCRRTRGLTYIFISHDLSVVKFMADMMAVMNDGKIVEFGPSETIYARPARGLHAAADRRDAERRSRSHPQAGGGAGENAGRTRAQLLFPNVETRIDLVPEV